MSANSPHVPEKLIRFFRYEVTDRWNQLNPDEVALVQGDRAKLIDLLQERYDFTIRRAQSEVENFFLEFESKIACAVDRGTKNTSTERKPFQASSPFTA